MRKIKVVHVANTDQGLRTHLGNCMRYQRDQGYSVSAITHPGRWLKKDSTILDGIFVKIMRFNPEITPLADLKTFIHLIHYFRRERFDIVHTHTIKPGLLARIAARITGVPVIVHTIHGFRFFEGMPRFQYLSLMLIEKFGSTFCDLNFFQSHWDIETAIEERICPPRKISYLGNGINLSRFDPGCISTQKVMALRGDLGIPSSQPVIGFVSRWEPDKGLKEFLEAASYLKSRGVRAKYLMVGAYPAGEGAGDSPKETLQKFGLQEEVIILGYREDIPELMTLMDIVVHPSYREGFPRVLMESASLAKPTVASKIPGNMQAVEDGVTGLLVPVRDGLALAEGIIKLLQNPDYAADLGRQARQRALNQFDERLFFWKTDLECRKLLKNKVGIDFISSLHPVPSM